MDKKSGFEFDIGGGRTKILVKFGEEGGQILGKNSGYGECATIMIQF